MAFDVKKELARFLAEDIGRGDITSSLLPKKEITARIIAREPCVLAGVKFAKEIFVLKGSTATIKKRDGSAVNKNDTVLHIRGTPQAVLSCERTALNLLSRMSGISTKTKELVRKVQGTRVRIYATRKTAPGLRYFDKLAVKIGGGNPHRMTLDEMVMIKDNHLAVADSLKSIIIKAKKRHKRIEVEVDNPSDAITAAENRADIIMLDNFSPEQITKIIKLLEENKLRKKVVIEASGGINSKNITKYAKTGIDIISVGEITNSVRGIDFSLEV